MNFTKMQGAGNDFILVETSDNRRNWSPLAIAMCDRHFGVGGDGLILVLPSTKADSRMREFNLDGSEAEACGNGLRCLVRYVVDRGLADSGAGQVLIETAGGIRKARLSQVTDKPVEIQVSMGKPEFRADDIPVTVESGRGDIVDTKSMLGYPVNIDGADLLLNLVSMGNPHAVYFSRQPVTDFPLSPTGPKVEHLAIFPNRTNFEVARVMSRQEIEVRVWERGVGETLACGSGACAVAVAARLNGYIDHKVSIKLPGGTLQIEWDGTGEVLMSGPAEKVFSGEWPE